MRLRFLLVALASTACSEELFDPGTMVLTSGQEPDVWGVEPAPKRVVVESENADGERTEVGTYDAPLESFSLGQGGATRYVVSGFDDADVVRARARSLPLSPGGFAEGKLPLFIQRTAQFARPPGNLESEQAERPPVAIVGGRYLVLAGGMEGERALLDGYDLGAWLPLAPPPSLGCPAPPCAIRSLAVVETRALAIGDDWAIWFDLDTAASGDVGLPDGLSSWASLAGGATITASDGSAYVVGATRAGEPTAAVVRVGTDFVVSAAALAAPRAGAAAAWVEARGLVVVGGAEPPAAGAELLADGASAFVPLAYPPDATMGAGLVPWSASSVLRLGGQIAAAPAPSVEISLACGTGCAPAAVGDAVALSRVSAFRVEPPGSGPAALAVGDDASGKTAAVRFDGTAREVPLKDPRTGGRAVALPTGHVAIAGGTPGTTIELYME